MNVRLGLGIGSLCLLYLTAGCVERDKSAAPPRPQRSSALVEGPSAKPSEPAAKQSDISSAAGKTPASPARDEAKEARRRFEIERAEVRARNSKRRDSYEKESRAFKKAKANYDSIRALRFAEGLERNARNAEDEGKVEIARVLWDRVQNWYRELIKDYPNSNGAAEAQNRLSGKTAIVLALPEVPIPPVQPVYEDEPVQQLDSPRYADRPTIDKSAPANSIIVGPTGSGTLRPIMGPSSGRTVHVEGHYRKNGSYVRPHYRSTPGSGSSRRR